jgi:Ferritin-like
MQQRLLRFPSAAESPTRFLRAEEAAAALAESAPAKPPELSDWDWAVFLLHTAAEVEHALMAQYLYAAYSLGPPFRGANIPSDAASMATRWQNVMLGIAREEMAHLATVQNVLRFIGGPLNLEREDFPFRSDLYPFPFHLEPLSRQSLAKYVAAEMPAVPEDDTGASTVVDEILRRVGETGHGFPVNRVGIVYSLLIKLLDDPERIRDSDLRPATAETLQARKQDWSGSDRLLVRQVASRRQAVEALDLIARQGEGSEDQPAGSPPSHFARLLQIYEEFPEAQPGQAADWVPSRPVPDNPNTLGDPSDDPTVEASRITDPTSLLWAQLCNVRYRMLLVDLAHAFQLAGEMGEAPDRTPRGRLRDRAMFEMRGQPPLRRAGLRGLARKLTGLPLKEGATEVGDPVAAPPFELPYTLNFSDQEHDRWRLHQALLDTSAELVKRIRASGDDPILGELEADDAVMRTLVADQLAAIL